MNTPIIEVRNLSKTFVLHQQGGVAIEALSGISFSVDAGECVALHGPSGAGKSTLLRALYGNYLPTGGSIRVRCGGEAESRPCLTSPAARRIFRDFVRRSAADLRIGGLAPGCCCAAAHLERPGKKELEHLDLDDCISFYLWGNRQLAKNGHHLRITPAAEGPFAGSVSAANLGEYPRLPLEEQ